MLLESFGNLGGHKLPSCQKNGRVSMGAHFAGWRAQFDQFRGWGEVREGVATVAVKEAAATAVVVKGAAATELTPSRR